MVVARLSWVVELEDMDGLGVAGTTQEVGVSAERERMDDSTSGR